MTPTTTALDAMLTVVGNVWDAASGYISTATSQPILFIPLAFGFAGATVGLFRRMTRLGKK